MPANSKKIKSVGTSAHKKISEMLNLIKLKKNQV